MAHYELIFVNWCVQCRKEFTEDEVVAHADAYPTHYFEEFYRWQEVGEPEPGFPIPNGEHPGIQYLLPVGGDETNVNIYMSGGGGDIHISLNDRYYEYFRTSNTVYTSASHIIWRGKSVLGTPKSIRYTGKISNNCTEAWFRIWDITNDKEISTVCTDSENWIVIHDYNLENISEEQSIWEIRVKSGYWHKNAYLSSVVVCFGGDDHEGYTGGTGSGGCWGGYSS